MNELFLYGEISGPADDFAAGITSLDGGSLLVRINSAGGDIFTAQAMYNLLKRYPGTVTVIIDGLAASAATVVAMAGDHIIMPDNALMMIHNPMSAINGEGYFTADELNKEAEVLRKVRQSLISIYMSRAKVSRETIERMLDNETWLSAQECLELGFIDEIQGIIPVEMTEKNIIMNHTSYPTAQFTNLSAIKQRIGGGKTMTKLESVLDKLGKLMNVSEEEEVKESKPEIVEEQKPTEEPELKSGDSVQPKTEEPKIGEGKEPAVEEEAIDVEAIKAQAVASERKRLADLELLRCGSASADAIINIAKEKGLKAEDITPFVVAVKKVDLAPAKAMVNAIVQDTVDSGAGRIASAPIDLNTEGEVDGRESAINFMVNVMNSKIRGGRN